MAIALDYFLKRNLKEGEERKVLALAIIDEDNRMRMFNAMNVDDCSEYLGERARIITYDNTIRNLYPYFTPEFIEDYELNKKVFDMFNYLKKETGHDISLSQLALATLGIDKELSRLPRNYDDSRLVEIEEKLEARARYIRDLWEFGLKKGYLFYYIRGLREKVEVMFNDNYFAD